MQNRSVIADRFEILKQLSQGGMGVVYLGQDLRTGKKVALKRLHDELAVNDPDILLRFAREGEILRQLNHPNIVKLLDTFEANDQKYLVLEYIGGGSLAELIQKSGPLPVDRVITIGLEIADALARVHHLKIIHRDIKPSNILLTEDGVPCLTDFGVALMGTSDVTKTGMMIGTLGYLPPEAFEGHLLDARSDIWSFGIMLFELLTGHRPFDQDHLSATMFAIMSNPVPDLESIRPDVPVALIDLIYRMLEKKSDQRIPNVRMIAAELDVLMQSDLPQTPMLRKQIASLPEIIDLPTPMPLHNLPVQTTPFVGRESELHELADLLNTPAIRLITILGPGGMGKTRLALETAFTQIDRYGHGVFFVPLAPVIAPDMIVTTLADMIRFQFFSGGDPKQQLLDYLRDKTMLIILDNFEHLLEGAGLVGEILGTAPGVKIVVTSRARINLQEETLLRIDGMAVPEAQQELAADAMTYSAIQLFFQSAKRVKPNFTLDQENIPLVVQICQQVQGLPLGILLAAAWVDLLTVSEISSEIAQNIDFLETSQQNIPTRQRSIRAVFEYSWNLLSLDERRVFAKLSVFRGGFTRDAAEKIAGATLRILAALINKSMLRRTPDGRYELHELLRQYVTEQIKDQLEVYTAVLTAHSTYFAALMKNAEAHIHSRQERSVMEKIAQDFDNVLLAWNSAVEQGNEPAIRHMLFSLDRYLAIQSLHLQKQELLEQAAQKLEALEPPGQKPSLRLGAVLGFLSICYADNSPIGSEKGLKINDRALTILRQYDAPHERAFTLLLRGWLDRIPAHRVEILEESVANFRKTDDLGWTGIVLFELSIALVGFANPERIATLVAESDAILVARGDPDTLITLDYHQGYLAAVQHDYSGAEEAFRRTLTFSRQINYHSMIANSLLWLAMTALMQNDYARAETFYQDVIALNRERPLFIYTELVLMKGLILLACQRNDDNIAMQTAQRAVQVAHDQGDPFFIAASLSQMARIHAWMGQFEEAMKQLCESLRLGRQTYMTLMPDVLMTRADILARQDKAEDAFEVLHVALRWANERLADATTPAMTYADNDFQLLLSRVLIEQRLVALQRDLSAEAVTATLTRAESRDLDSLLDSTC
jgi:predicted ATPase